MVSEMKDNMEDINLKLIDIDTGVKNTYKVDETTLLLDSYFLAPETIAEVKEASLKTNIWSLGTILHILING